VVIYGKSSNTARWVHGLGEVHGVPSGVQQERSPSWPSVCPDTTSLPIEPHFFQALALTLHNLSVFRR
jgi:hypothetical protein